MTPLRFRRTSALRAGSALAATALVVATAAPASAVPVEGNVAASTSASVSGGCDVETGPNAQSVVFTNKTGPRTAQVDSDYHAFNGDNAAASGHSDVETTASGSVKDRAFKRVDVESTAVISMTNGSDVGCALEMDTRSETEVELKVRSRGGKIKIAWASNTGDLAVVSVTGPSGTLLSKNPTRAEGSYLVKVPPGRYTLTSIFLVAASEGDVNVGHTKTTIGFYTLRATYVK
ncbi:hypothetical protein F0U44_07295 [Nocardioides humilatus]|uniref:Uncharacterized protein n=1 Tax=Nocardioides humilatus TaxID=2607660 RepID=A0A5B1LHU1_9ACTN|nr:hypothetical protein [Nocardioides humilatus]KAA1420222.1 hypothetical protein F0U44_07295 [Nocardioides humilatus]